MGVLGGMLQQWRAGRTSGDSSLSKPAEWLVNLFGGGGQSKAGVTVTEANATNLSAVWACVRSISEDVAKLPLKVYKRTGEAEDDRQVVRSHPAYRLLNAQANSDLTPAFILREFLGWSVKLWGNGFAEIERTRSGRPIALWPMLPARTQLRRNEAGDLEYLYRSEGGAEVTLPAEDVLHVRGPTKDGIVGYSVVSQARESLGAAMATDQFAQRFWANGARPSGAIRIKGKLSPVGLTNMRESIDRLYTGAANAGRPIVLEEDAEFTPFSVPPEDAQFLETRQFSVIEICRWFRVPPHKVFDLARATFSNIEHQGIEYVQDGLGAWMVRWEQECNIKLLSSSERETHYFEHLADALLRGDTKTRFDAYGVARQWGWMSANEIRARENMNRLPAEDGDQYLAPVNMTTPEKLAAMPAAAPPAAPASPAAPAPAADPEPEVDARSIAQAFEPVIADVLGRVLRVEAERARRAAKAGTLAAWSDEYYRDHATFVCAAVFAGVESMGRVIRCFDPRAGDDFVPALTRQLANRHVELSRAEIRAAAAGGAADVGVCLATWEGSRAERDASAARDLIAACLEGKAKEGV